MLDISIKLSKVDDEESDFLKFKFEYDKFRGDRRGVRALSVDLKATTWSWETLETEKLLALAEYLSDHPTASLRVIAKALPELGNHVTIRSLKRKLEEATKR